LLVQPPPAVAAEPAPRVEEAPPTEIVAASEIVAVPEIAAPEVVREEVQTPAPVQPPAAPPQPGRADPATILASLNSATSDLVQIETDPHKVQPLVEEEEAPRPMRVRRPPPIISDEPLVQIETRRREPEPLQQA
jgi:ribonuclease E